MNNNKFNIGIINLMPDVEEYHREVVDSFAELGHLVNLYGVRMKTKSYPVNYLDFIDQHYFTLEQLAAEVKLDGLIISGAPVELLPFEQVDYWLELEQLIKEAIAQECPTFGICWGGLAIGKVFGVEKINFDYKIFGVYCSEYHPVNGSSLDASGQMPFSIRACFDPSSAEQQIQSGQIQLLANHGELAHSIMQSVDAKHIMCLGHPEYAEQRLVNEWQRDVKINPDMPLPVGVDVTNPTADWRNDSTRLFQFWLSHFNADAAQKD